MNNTDNNIPVNNGTPNQAIPVNQPVNTGPISSIPNQAIPVNQPVNTGPINSIPNQAIPMNQPVNAGPISSIPNQAIPVNQPVNTGPIVNNPQNVAQPIPVVGQVPNANDNQNQNKKKPNKLFIILLFIIFLGILGFLVFTVLNEDSGKKNKLQKEPTNNKNLGTDNVMSSDWRDCTFTMGGVVYKLNNNYTEFENNGWTVDLKKYGYDDGYILNKENKVTSILYLNHEKYDKDLVNIGFVNRYDTPVDIIKSQYWAISVDNSFATKEVDFILPGNIKNGSTIEEIEAVYGKPEPDNIFRAEELKYTVYDYEHEFSIYLKLTIYDEGGLKGFNYKIY